MTCVHLQRLYQLCHAESLRLSSSELVQLVCLQCGKQEVCPSVLMDEYDQNAPQAGEEPSPTKFGGDPPGRPDSTP